MYLWLYLVHYKPLWCDITEVFTQYIGHTKRTLSERMCEHFRYITQHNSAHSVGQHFNMEQHDGLGNVKLHVLQFGKKDPDSKESLEIRLSLELLWIHRLRSTTPMGLNVFDWIRSGPLHLTPANPFTPVTK